MRGVRKLTRAAYANQRMTLNSEIAKFQVVKRNTMNRAAWSNPRGAFCHSCFTTGVWRCLELDVSVQDAPRSFVCGTGGSRFVQTQERWWIDEHYG